MHDFVQWLKKNKDNMKRFILIISLILIFTGCVNKQIAVAKIRIKGSDTMLLLTQRLAEEYMRNNPGISIYVEGGGTSSGVQSISDATADICTASRTLNPQEVKVLSEKFSSIGLSFLVARDGLSIYLHPDNPVKNLTISQLEDIFTGKIINWKEVGGSDIIIEKIVRTPNSGTYTYFKEHVLNGKEYDSNSIVKHTTNSIIKHISKSENAIGYGGIGYNDGIRLSNINGISSSEENVRNNDYPICRYLYFYTPSQPRGEIQKFINWVMSIKGQKLVKESGYIPIWRITY